MSRRRALEPFDITLRHGRRYQLARRLFLGFWVAATFLLPLWHLRALEVASAGFAGDAAGAALARHLPTVAPPLVGAPTAVGLWSLELVDPLLLAGVALTRGVDAAWLWALVPGLALVLLLGRFFCGWACPYLPVLAASVAARGLLAKLGIRTLDVRVPRVTAVVVAVGVLLATVLTGAQVAPLIYPPAILGREVFRVLFYGSLGAGALVVLAAFLFDTFVSRAGFCRSLCPGGATFSLLSALSPVRVTRDVALCTDCTVCDVVCNLGQSPMTDKLDSGCERCGKCIASCPTKALSWRLAAPPLVQRSDRTP